MKPRLPYLTIISVLFCLSTVACSSKQTGVQSNATNDGGPTAESGAQQGGVAGAKNASGKKFRGSVGDKKVEMTLRRDGDKLEGTYFYRKVGSELSLSGTIDSKGKFTLKEFDNSGKQTGSFKGDWDDSPNMPTVMLGGSWSKPGSTDELSFYAIEQAIEFTNGLRVVEKEIREDEKKKPYWLAADYPELTGLANLNVDKFNAKVKSIVTKETQDFKKSESETTESDTGMDPEMRSFLEVGYDITLATNDLVSLVFNITNYERGAAHPNSRSLVVNYDLKNGRMLELSELFKPGSDYLNVISRYSIADLKKQANDPDYPVDMIEQGAAPAAENFEAWNISRKGLAITFDPYQVASYAEGPKHVVVPNGELKSVVRADGPLATSAP
jgi:hypothetical protein